MDTASGNNKICERSNPEMCVMLYSTAPSAAEESVQSDFPHSLLDLCTSGRAT
jgi:hypothetical protein